MNIKKRNSKLKKIINLLKLLLEVDDMEIIKSSIESIIEKLEEMDQK